MSVKKGAFCQKQLSPEEIAEAEAAAAAAAAAKKPAAGKNAPKVEEPTPEQLEQQARLKAEKEEKAWKLKEEWDALDPETKFYWTHEDIYKEAAIWF